MLTPPPNVDGFAEPCPKAGTMTIYHRFMCENGHFHLLKLTCFAEYRPYLSFRQTTICTASHDINSCIWGPENDRQAAFAQWIARVRGRSPALELYRCGVRAERHADRYQPSDQAAGAGTGSSPVRPAEPRAGVDAGSQGLSSRCPR